MNILLISLYAVSLFAKGASFAKLPDGLSYRPWKRDVKSLCQDKKGDNGPKDASMKSLLEDKDYAKCQWLLYYTMDLTAAEKCKNNPSINAVCLPIALQDKVQAATVQIVGCNKAEQVLITGLPENPTCKWDFRKDSAKTVIPPRDLVWVKGKDCINVDTRVCHLPWKAVLLAVPSGSNGGYWPPDNALSPRIIVKGTTCNQVGSKLMEGEFIGTKFSSIPYDIVGKMKMNLQSKVTETLLPSLKTNFAPVTPVMDKLLEADTASDVLSALGASKINCNVVTQRFMAMEDACQHMSRVAFQVGTGQLAPNSKLKYLIIPRIRLAAAGGNVCPKISLRVLPVVQDLNALCDPIPSETPPVPIENVAAYMKDDARTDIVVLKSDLSLPAGHGLIVMELFAADGTPCQQTGRTVPNGYYITAVLEEIYALAAAQHELVAKRKSAGITMSRAALSVAIVAQMMTLSS